MTQTVASSHQVLPIVTSMDPPESSLNGATVRHWKRHARTGGGSSHNPTPLMITSGKRQVGEMEVGTSDERSLKKSRSINPEMAVAGVQPRQVL